MLRSYLVTLLLVCAAGPGWPGAAFAQSLGSFRWQLQSYCNIVTLAVTQNGPVFELEGTDDQCGAGQAASAIGTAFINPDGSVGFGLNIVSAPSGAPVHVEATISLATLNGTWHDSLGGTGAFVFTPGAGTGGSPRPAASSSIPTGSIGSAQINPAQVQRRIAGSCPGASFMQGVTEDGTVSCSSAAGDITEVAAGLGLVGGGSSGNVTLGLPTTPGGGLSFNNLNGLVAGGSFGLGIMPAEGPGVRMMWLPNRAAFRAGHVDGDAWDDANIGFESVAFNKNTRATGIFSSAFGDSTLASGVTSTAMGNSTTASGIGSLAIGEGTVASGAQSVALGYFSTASGFSSLAMGRNVTASGVTSVALGFNAVAAGLGSFSFADQSSATPFTAFDNQFVVRASGGAGVYTNSTLSAGVELAPGASSWSSVSDVNMKENFRDLDGHDVLAKLARMSIHEWNYKAQNAGIRHVGPTAQDFHAAFGLGESPLRISTIDADGIALAGLKALEARDHEQHDALVRQSEALVRENDALKAALAAVQERLDRLEAKR